VREALELYASFYPNPADWRELLERWGLAGKADTGFAKLSGGQKQRLFISEATVKTHVLHIYAKLGVNDRAAAVATGFERGLLPRP